MNDDDKKEILAAIKTSQEENSNQNVAILGQIQTLQDHHLESQQRMNQFEEALQDLKTNPPQLTPSVRTAISTFPRDRLPTLTGEERREQIMTVTKSIGVQADASAAIASSNDTIAKTVRLLPYVTLAGMVFSAFLAGVMQYFMSHPMPQQPQIINNIPSTSVSAIPPAPTNTVPAPAR